MILTGMISPDIAWSLFFCVVCVGLLIAGKRSMKKLLLIGALLLILTARVQGTI